MSNDLSPTSPERFGLSSFAEFLPKRDPIIGEDPGSFAGFHDGMMRSLTPFTPYECVIAENLIAIEWELLQQRRMRDASLRQQIRAAVCRAVMDRERKTHDAALAAAWDSHVAQGGNKNDWKEPFTFDAAAARKLADDLASRATSRDPDLQSRAYDEILELGLAPLELMGNAYLDPLNFTLKHDEKTQELERRRREVRRDYDALQKARPLDGEIIEG